jgi:hypothetical protein
MKMQKLEERKSAEEIQVLGEDVPKRRHHHDKSRVT